MAQYAREPRAYELMAILLPELADEELTGAIDRVAGYITDAAGTIKETLTDSPWGRRRLAYTIRFNSQDYRDGYYAIWHFDLEPSRMTEIERELKLDTRVIRYLMVHDDPKWGSPNEGNQPPAGDAGDAPATWPTRTRPTSTPAAERDAAATATAEPAAAPAEATAAEASAATTDDVVATTDDSVTTTGETVGTSGDAIETDPGPEETASAAVAGASGEETTAVVEDTTGAAVEAPAGDEPVAEAEPAGTDVESTDPDTDDKKQEA